MGRHLPTPAASVLTWHRPPPSPRLTRTRASPSLPVPWSREQSQVAPPGKAPTRNEWTAPPHVANWSQVHHALTACYKRRWKHKRVRVALHLPSWSTADRQPRAPGHKPRRDLSTASAQAVGDLLRELLGWSHPGAESWIGATRQHQNQKTEGSCMKTFASPSSVVAYLTTYPFSLGLSAWTPPTEVSPLLLIASLLIILILSNAPPSSHTFPHFPGSLQ